MREELLSCLGAYVGAAAGTVYMSLLYESWRHNMTTKEIYDEAYKHATGGGERHDGAHHQGLEAVYQEAQRRVVTHPVRSAAHRWVSRLEKRLRT